MYKVYNKESETFHVIDIIETYGNQTVVFTEDSKCFPIEKTFLLTSDKLKCIQDNLSKKSLSDTDYEEFDIIVKGYIGDRLRLTDIDRKEIQEEFKSILDDEKLKSKKSTKEYLLSPLSNLWSTLARPWTSKG